MSFSIGNRQLSLANPTHAAENKHLSAGAESVGLRLQDRFHLLNFGLSTNKEILTHVRCIVEIKTEIVF